MPDTAYTDCDGNPCTLDTLCRREPAWAANRIRVTLATAERLRARVVELEAPGECQSLHKLRALLRRWLADVHPNQVADQLCDDTRAALGLDRSNP